MYSQACVMGFVLFNEAIFLARDIADCLLEDDPFENWDAIKNKKGEAAHRWIGTSPRTDLI